MHFKLVKLLSFFIIFYIFSCGHPLDYFYKEVERYGYHNYVHPMKIAATGTLVSGSSRAMNIEGNPETCFPSTVPNLRFKDETELPTRSESFSIDIDLQADFFKALSTASPSIKANFRMKEVHQIDLKMSGIHIEYFDTINLIRHYRDTMSKLCKSYIESGVSYITQVIKVDKMEFSFYKKNKGRIFIDADNIQEYLDLSLDLRWSIEEKTKLIITTPKYIGYHLGRVQKRENGNITIFRTESRGRDRWSFYEVATIDPEELELVKDLKNKKTVR